MTLDTVIKLTVSTVVALAGMILRFITARKRDAASEAGDEKSVKKCKTKIRLFTALFVLGLWYFIGILVNYISGKGFGNMEVSFEMFSERTVLFGISFANTTLLAYLVTAVMLILALLFRFIVYPRFRAVPKGIQNVIETAVDEVYKFTKGQVGEKYAASLAPYMFSLALFMIGCAATELVGQRPPTSDLLITGSMGLLTFVIINIYGICQKGVGGRLKGMATPSPVIFPMKILSDVAVPVSLACRLFGNMLGGMIVMELLKSSLGGYAIGVTALAGLYFNLFHPLIQTYIFIVLSLTFINEAVE